jgi:hypothetical protein
MGPGADHDVCRALAVLRFELPNHGPQAAIQIARYVWGKCREAARERQEWEQLCDGDGWARFPALSTGELGNPEQNKCRHHRALIAGAVACAFFSAIVLFARAMSLQFNHDENQFLAAGALIARHNLWPFRDYAYFHAPGEPALLAVIFKFTTHKLMAARCLSVAAAVGIALLLFGTARRNVALALAAAAIFLFNPMSAYTASLAWNHSLPVFCTLAALLLLERPARSRAIFAGICAGCAVMFRHSYPPVVLALAIYIAMNADWRRVAIFLASAAAVTAPLLLLPLRQLYFGLLVYPSLSKQYWAAQPMNLPRTIGQKLHYLAHVNLTSLAPATLLVTAIAAAAFAFRGDTIARRKIIGVLLVIVALLIGILAPTPTMQQYPFAVVPFLVLMIVYGISTMRKWAQWVVVIPLIGALWAARTDVGAMRMLVYPNQWVPVRINHVARKIPPDTAAPIFTLAPLFPVEANLDFDPACATGPFAWRIAPQLSQAERTQCGIVGADDWWKRDVGTLILGDRNIDDIAASATAHGFRKVRDEKAYSVWKKDSAGRDAGAP